MGDEGNRFQLKERGKYLHPHHNGADVCRRRSHLLLMEL
jgi:hypothetical protein